LSAVTPGSEFMNVRGSMDFYRERLMKEPDVVRNYVELAQLHLQEARTTGSEGEHLRPARKLLEEALDRDPENFHALALKGSLLNKLHRFEEASEIAEGLVARNNHSAFAHGILVDALVELGRYEEAVGVADRMQSLRPDISSYARVSYLRELHGDAQGAVAAMRLAADAGVAGTEDRAWALYNLGSLYLEAGKSDTAAFVFEGILEERPGYAYALGGLGRVEAYRGRHENAVIRYGEAYEEQPNPEFLSWMMDSYDQLGMNTAGLKDRIHTSLADAREMGENVDMEYADFLAEHQIDPAEALRLIKKEYARRPDHLHVLETYAWTLHRLGRSRDAVPFIQRAMRMGTRDATMHDRAAQIFGDAGRDSLRSIR
jgi:pentatricopeptide repeat protein